LDRLHWIDAERLTKFILACQDTETGVWVVSQLTMQLQTKVGVPCVYGRNVMEFRK